MIFIKCEDNYLVLCISNFRFLLSQHFLQVVLWFNALSLFKYFPAPVPWFSADSASTAVSEQHIFELSNNFSWACLSSILDLEVGNKDKDKISMGWMWMWARISSFQRNIVSPKSWQIPMPCGWLLPLELLAAWQRNFPKSFYTCVGLNSFHPFFPPVYSKLAFNPTTSWSYFCQGHYCLSHCQNPKSPVGNWPVSSSSFLLSQKGLLS